MRRHRGVLCGWLLPDGYFVGCAVDGYQVKPCREICVGFFPGRCMSVDDASVGGIYGYRFPSWQPADFNPGCISGDAIGGGRGGTDGFY